MSEMSALAHGQLRPCVTFHLPPCERHFIIHYRDGEPYGLLIDGKPHRVKQLKGRGTGVRDEDSLLVVVEYGLPV